MHNFQVNFVHQLDHHRFPHVRGRGQPRRELRELRFDPEVDVLGRHHSDHDRLRRYRAEDLARAGRLARGVGDASLCRSA